MPSEQRDDGTEPERRVDDTLKDFKFERAPSSTGMVEDREVPAKLRLLILLNKPSVVGIAPRNLLPDSDRYLNFDSRPTVEGIVPDKPVEVKSKVVKEDNCIIEVGMDPPARTPDRLMPTISTLAQVTPAQPHTLVTEGWPPEHVHPALPWAAGLIAATKSHIAVSKKLK